MANSLYMLFVKNDWTILSDEVVTICVTYSGGTSWLQREGFRLVFVRFPFWASDLTPTDLRYFVVLFSPSKQIPQ